MCTVPTEHTQAPAGQHASLIFSIFWDFTVDRVCYFISCLLYLYCISMLYKHSGLLYQNFQELELLTFIIVTVKHEKLTFSLIAINRPV